MILYKSYAKFFVLGISLFGVISQQSFAAGVSAPTVVKSGYGLGAKLRQGSDSLPGTWNHVNFVFTFIYEGDTSGLQAFRLYEKKSSGGFVRVAEFNNLIKVTSSRSAVSGTWAVSRLNTTWTIIKWNQALVTIEPVALYEPVSAYPPGAHSYYVTAVDASGNESAPSQTYNLNVLGSIAVLSPTMNIPAALVPIFKWSSAGWPDSQVLYTIKINDGQSTIWSKTQINQTGELAYDGASLNPAKKYILNIQGHWTNDALKPLDAYFAAISSDLVFQVKANQPPPPTPSPSSILTPIPTPTPKIILPPRSSPVPTFSLAPDETPTPSPTPMPAAPVPPGFFARIFLAIINFFMILFRR
ncbi:MAG: hypothetical protein Q7S12_04005 [bacterium]|nr:hypothetical protein [bacterium]